MDRWRHQQWTWWSFTVRETDVVILIFMNGRATIFFKALLLKFVKLGLTYFWSHYIFFHENIPADMVRIFTDHSPRGAPLVLVITFWFPILQLSYVILFILPFFLTVFCPYIHYVHLSILWIRTHWTSGQADRIDKWIELTSGQNWQVDRMDKWTEWTSGCLPLMN